MVKMTPEVRNQFNRWEMEQQVLRSPFDIETHKRTFIDYLEVIILEDGTIEYAVPGHQMKLLELASTQLNLPYEDIGKSCPKEFYGDFNLWLSMQVKAISLWTYMYEGIPNEKQLEVMDMLKKEKLYNGNIPTMEEVLMKQRIYSARLPK